MFPYYIGSAHKCGVHKAYAYYYANVVLESNPNASMTLSGRITNVSSLLCNKDFKVIQEYMDNKYYKKRNKI